MHSSIPYHGQQFGFRIYLTSLLSQQERQYWDIKRQIKQTYGIESCVLGVLDGTKRYIRLPLLRHLP